MKLVLFDWFSSPSSNRITCKWPINWASVYAYITHIAWRLCNDFKCEYSSDEDSLGGDNFGDNLTGDSITRHHLTGEDSKTAENMQTF